MELWGLFWRISPTERVINQRVFSTESSHYCNTHRVKKGIIIIMKTRGERFLET